MLNVTFHITDVHQCHDTLFHAPKTKQLFFKLEKTCYNMLCKLYVIYIIYKK